MDLWHTVIDAAVSCPGGGQRFRRVAVARGDNNALQVAWPGAQGTVAEPTHHKARMGRARGAAQNSDTLCAPMAARVLAVHVQAGATVAAQQPLLVLEAMKMEHTVVAPQARGVATVCVAPGDQVAHGQQLVVFTQEGTP